MLNIRGMSITRGADYAFLDQNGVKISASVQDSFYNISIYSNSNGKLTLHNNDPELAHRDCGFVKYKNYHFIRGKLYKCGPVALMPEFDQQHTLTISDEDRNILNSYQPLTVDNFAQHGKDFLDNIDNVIPQCKFCPTNFVNQKLIAVSKKQNATGVFSY